MNVELAEHMTWWESHEWDIYSIIVSFRTSQKKGKLTEQHTSRIPSTQDDPSIRRVLLNLPNTLCQLINPLPPIIPFTIPIPRPKMPPLEPIHRPQIPLPPMSQPPLLQKRLAPIPIPDLHPLLRKQLAIRRPVDEPEQFFDDPPEERPFRRQQRKGVVGEGEAQRGRGEEGECAGAGAVWADGTGVEDGSNEVEVLLFLVLLRGRSHFSYWRCFRLKCGRDATRLDALVTLANVSRYGVTSRVKVTPETLFNS